MSDIETTLQNCLKPTQAMIEFLGRHEMSYWADRFELIAKALETPDANKALGLLKKNPVENLERLFAANASRDRRESADDTAQLKKLTDDVTKTFSRLKAHVKGEKKESSAAKSRLGQAHLKGRSSGTTTGSGGGASAPRRTSSD